MKIAAIIGTIIVVMGGLFFVFSAPETRSNAQNSQNTTETPARTFANVAADVQNDAKLVDVRTPEEYVSGHFADAALFPLQDIEAGKYPEYPKDSKIYVYCRSGNRSSQAKTLLEKAGYTNIIDLGGLSDVQKIGGTLAQ